MEKVTTIAGIAAPLTRANIDTDQIIPKQFLKRVERTGFGEFLFYDWAADAEGELDPDFILNKAEYRDSVALIAGPNFGSGSSREHAPWALQDWGFQTILAPSFADIFYNNCINIGLLPVVLDGAVIDELARAASDPNNFMTVELAAQTVTCGSLAATFEIDEFHKHCLLNGLDQIGITMEHSGHISEFESARPSYKPNVR